MAAAVSTIALRKMTPPLLPALVGAAVVALVVGSFFGRVNFLDSFLFPRNRPMAIPVLATTPTAEAMVDEAVRRLIDDNISPESRETLYTYARTIADPQERAAAVAYLVLASPEYQLI